MTFVSAVLASRTAPSLSFEFFPPRDDADAQRLARTAASLRALKPDFCSITYGANGSTRRRTIAASLQLARDQAAPLTVGHLTAASQSREELIGTLERYRGAGIRNILAIRGDMAGGPTEPWRRHPQGLDNATQLVELIGSLGGFCTGVAAFPDPHQPDNDPELDARILLDKVEAGAQFAVTQLFFDARRYVDLVERMRARGCDIPILAGIMPLTSLGQIDRFAELTGTPLPADFVAQLRACGDDPEAVRQAGIDRAVDLCTQVLQAGAPGLQFFTMNRARVTQEVIARLPWSR